MLDIELFVFFEDDAVEGVNDFSFGNGFSDFSDSSDSSSGVAILDIDEPLVFGFPPNLSLPSSDSSSSSSSPKNKLRAFFVFSPSISVGELSLNLRCLSSSSPSIIGSS